jgi:hypothetical protein
MIAIGVDPLTLTPDDVAWHYCWERRRGWAVQEALAAMQHEGRDHREPAGLQELLDRAEALRAPHLAPLRRVRSPKT